MTTNPKITRAQALEQVCRFSRHSRYPASDDPEEYSAGENELITAFQDASRSPEHALKIGDWIMRYGVSRGYDRQPDARACPMPADIHEAAILAIGNRVPEFTGIRDVQCRDCGDTGFAVKNHDGVGTVTHCHCHPARKGAA